MKKLTSFFLVALLFCSCGQNSKNKSEVTENQTFKVLQFNIWQEGTIVDGGYEGIVRQILASKADFITLSEVRNYKDTRFCDRIVQSLQDSGHIFYSFYSYDSGILSRYPILDSTTIYPCVDDHGSAYRALIDMNGKEVALYTTHLDYLNCTYYDAKGYDGSTFQKRPPMTNLDSIMANNVLSKRDDGMQAILNAAEQDRLKDRIIIIGGDFNEPSHQDWIDQTKDLYGRNGLIVPWTVSKMLAEKGYVDAYRTANPDPVTHPGMTFPCHNPQIAPSKITWMPEADERERVDFIYFLPYDGLQLDSSIIWGPRESVAYSKVVNEETQDVFEIGEGIWPTDHKGVFARFTLSVK